MSDPNHFLGKIEKIVGAEFNSQGRLSLDFQCENHDEARELLHRFRSMQKELRALKRDVNHSIKDIRSMFATKKTNVGKGLGSMFATGLLGRRAVGGFNAVKRDSLRIDRDNEIAPYTELKNIIDDIIHQIDKQKYAIESSDIYRNKPKPKPKSQKRDRKSGLSEKARRYFVNLQGDIKGPLTTEQIEGLLAADVADENTLLCVEGEHDWHPMKHFFELPS